MYTPSQFRSNMRQAFNDADQGHEVVIERFGQKYQLVSLVNKPLPGHSFESVPDDAPKLKKEGFKEALDEWPTTSPNIPAADVLAAFANPIRGSEIMQDEPSTDTSSSSKDDNWSGPLMRNPKKGKL